MSEEIHFGYIAIEPGGRRVRGALQGVNASAVHARLRADGLTPLEIRALTDNETNAAGSRALADRATATLVTDLAALLQAGADMRSALTIIASKAATPALAATARLIAGDVSGGDSLDQALRRRLGRKHAFVAALASAGEASGDLAGSLERAGEVLETRMAMREQILSAVSYPAFVLLTAIFGFAVILLLVIPSLAPLTEASGSPPGFALSILMAMSRLLSEHLVLLIVMLGVCGAAITLAALTGMLAPIVDRLLLDGPLKGPISQLVYGGFTVTLGGILAAGAQIGDALRFAVETARSQEARRRLSPLLQSVRQGEALSDGLGKVYGMPRSIIRLAAIGEESGALGTMIARAGRIEEEAAVRRISSLSRMLGPVMIVLLGALIGLLMAGLLSGITDIGAAALN